MFTFLCRFSRLYHVEIDGKPHKFVIGKNKEEYAPIESVSPANLALEQLKKMSQKYLYYE